MVLIGEPDDPLAQAYGARARGFIPVHGRPMLQCVVTTLRACGCEVVVVGADTLREEVRARADVNFVSAPMAISRKLRAGMEALGHPHQALMCAADSPFASVEGLRAFMQTVIERRLDLAYPIIPREVSDAAFPGGRRTYVKMREGTFTGGNFLVLSDEFVIEAGDWIDRFFAARKSPLKLANMLGWPLALKLALGRLSIDEAERLFTKRVGARAAAVISRDAGMGFDIDKREDLELAERVRQN